MQFVDYMSKVENALQSNNYFEITEKYSPVICHWLDFSVFCPDDIGQVKDFVNWLNSQFGFEFIENLDRFGNDKGLMPGFTKSYYCKKTTASISYGGVNEFMKDHIFFRFTGKAVQYLYENNIFYELLFKFNEINNSGESSCRCVRIDLAKDCFTGFFDFVKEPSLETRQRIVTTLKTFSYPLRNLDNRMQVKSGWTFYAGRRYGGILVRVYDKGAERGVQLPDGKTWTRVELEIKHSDSRTDWANDVFNALCDGEHISVIYKAYLMKYFRILEPNSVSVDDSNRNKKTPTDAEFLEFVDYDIDDKNDKHKFCELLSFVDYTKKQKDCQELCYATAPISFEGQTLGEILAHLILICEKSREKYLRDYGIYLTSHIDDKDILQSVPFLAIDVGKFELVENIKVIERERLFNSQRAFENNLDDIIDTL